MSFPSVEGGLDTSAGLTAAGAVTCALLRLKLAAYGATRAKAHGRSPSSWVARDACDEAGCSAVLGKRTL